MCRVRGAVALDPVDGAVALDFVGEIPDDGVGVIERAPDDAVGLAGAAMDEQPTSVAARTTVKVRPITVRTGSTY
jgi:hypothetical protein